MSRTRYSIKNMKYVVAGQIAALLISFISRTVFTRVLSADYLGLNGLFSNILSIISLAELGFGSAIVFSMYKPLAEHDEDKIASLMVLYKHVYTIVGIVVLLAGISLSLFLDFFLKEIPNIPHITLIYLLFVINSSISYFYSYKRSLIIADQKRYIETIYKYSLYFALNIIQIIILLLTRSYILFLVIQIVFTLLENKLVSRKADHLYPFINKKNIRPLEENERKTIFKKVKAMMFHKIGTVVVNGTDNILISKYVGVVEVGIYSNYQLIINALNTIYSLLFDSLTASIGNLGVTESNEHKKYVFDVINFFGFWIYGFSSICLFILINPFIKLWLGENYNFNIVIVLIITINFYLTGMRKSVLVFRNALGLFWYDRYKPIIEALINLITSFLLVHHLGIAGVFIGTLISTLTVCFWVEPYILYKYGFEQRSIGYFIKYIVYTLILLITAYITWDISKKFNNNDLLSLVIQIGICVVIPNVIFAFAFWRTKEFRHIINLARQLLLETMKKIKNWLIVK